MKRFQPKSLKPLQRKPTTFFGKGDFFSNSTASSGLQKKEGNTLPDSVKNGTEALSGLSMDDVTVHYNSSSPASLQAHAYTKGSDIYVGPGQEKHLAHEAWHVVQQKQGRVKPTVQLKGNLVNGDPALEKEADIMGERILASSPESSQTPTRKVVQSGMNSPVIQGRFGFELEVTVAMEALHKGQFVDPAATHGIKVGQGNGFKVHVDHQKHKFLVGKGVVEDAVYNSKHGIPIIEIVTDPLDEFSPTAQADLDNVIGDVETFRDRLKAERGNRTPLNTLGIGTVNKPINNVVVGGKKAGAQNLNTYAHATYGIKLSQVPAAFARHATDISAQRGVNEPLAQNLTKAVAAADAITDWVFQKYRDRERGILRWKDLNAYDIHNQADLDKMKGLITLMTNYIIAFTKNPGHLNKNQVGAFFYKSALSDVPALLSPKQRSLLSNKASKLAAKIIQEAGIQRGDAIDTRFDWTTWIKNVLKGKKDTFQAGSINPYSPRLGPEPVGPAANQENAVVMENRYVAEMLRGVGRKIPENEWGDMMRSVLQMLRQLNA